VSRSILRASIFSGAAVLAALAMTGCATKGFVREQVAQEGQRTDAKVADVDTHVGRVEGTAKDALDRANAAHKLAEGKFLYQVVLSDDSVKFPTNVHALSQEAEARLNEFAERLKSENRNVYLEIQGHTDAQGSEDYNEKLGEARAEAVRRYLNQQGVALNRMSTISYGKDSPVAPNNTAEGRAQNRRVVIVVLV
jgi:outer membrane protein OmpA-like peptidoglycan-associated protein